MSWQTPTVAPHITAQACFWKGDDWYAGARFAKWRAVLKIADGGPSLEAMESNAHGLAAYAKIAQVSLANLELVCSLWIAPEQTKVKRSYATCKGSADANSHAEKPEMILETNQIL